MQGFFDTLRIELRGSGCVGCVTGVCCNRYPTRALGADGQPLGQSPRDETRQYDGGGMCASNRLGDGTTQTRAHHDVERQSDTLGKALPELVDRIAAYAARATTSAEK